MKIFSSFTGVTFSWSLTLNAIIPYKLSSSRRRSKISEFRNYFFANVCTKKWLSVYNMLKIFSKEPASLNSTFLNWMTFNSLKRRMKENGKMLGNTQLFIHFKNWKRERNNLKCFCSFRIGSDSNPSFLFSFHKLPTIAKTNVSLSAILQIELKKDHAANKMRSFKIFEVNKVLSTRAENCGVYLQVCNVEI